MEKAEKSAYRNSWIAEKLDRINFTMPKGKKEKVKEYAEKQGLSLNAYINLAIDERMERDEMLAAGENRHFESSENRHFQFN